MPDLTIEIAWNLRTDWRAKPLLCRVAQHVASAEGFTSGSLSIAVVGNRAMATLHERSLGIAGPTDVLTFDLGSNQRAGVLDAEIVVCADVARRNAKDKTLRAATAELALYLTHGLLHLAGYDDQTERDYKRMHFREDVLLKQLGLGPVFSRGT